LKESGSLTGASSTASKSAVRRYSPRALRERNPALAAWLVLLSAFAVFLACAIASPLLIGRYVQYATRSNRAEVQTLSGTTQLLQRNQQKWLAISDAEDASQGDVIQTDGTSRALLVVYEGSTDYVLATVHVFSDTRLSLARATNPQFARSSQPNRITLVLDHGRIRLNPGPPLDRDLQLRVIVPSGEVAVQDGSVALEVSADASEVTVRGGRALVTSNSHVEQMVLETGERAVLTSQGDIRGPLPAGRNLLTNGDFGGGLMLGWQVYNDQGSDSGTVDGQATLLDNEVPPVVEFDRGGGQKDHCETGLLQPIKKDVTDYVSLRVRMDVRLLYQSLSGGGFQSSEFPLMYRLVYRDARGNLQFYTWGFYYQNTDNYPVQKGEQIERNVWFAYESPDLMAILGDIKPAYLEYIQVYASGHDYQSQVRDVQVVAE